MAIVINGSGTVTGLAVGGLPDGTVDAGTLATNSVDSAELINGAVDDSHIASGALPTEIYVGQSQETDATGYITNFTAVADTDSGMVNSTGIYTVQTAGNFIIYCTKHHNSATVTRDIINMNINNAMGSEIVETNGAYVDNCGFQSRQLSAGDTIRFYMHALHVSGRIEVEIRRII